MKSQCVHSPSVQGRAALKDFSEGEAQRKSQGTTLQARGKLHSLPFSLWLFHLLSRSWFGKISSLNLNSQIIGTKELKFWEKVDLLPLVTCQVSHVTCHMSHVACHMSFFFWQSGEASQWRLCYHWGLPRLVFSANYGYSKSPQAIS